ncbi:HPr family phosphocarrier protein [Phytomonospora endophytica]|uniref:Phosphocarrier protein HPr n=1 Tax=Phytomonospora endophytica TaxID=714109 RepID=A0A841FZH4_9ACTN|nr:HPr family phosphocarrier protein [Phytomonospora endophytica]MBB6038777.1 phosphocarrier protein [Phytomonospora endophytica]GIG68427.1 phosphotransferase [Phytomonospora endophytica]
MPSRTVAVASASGLHARPAALFVKAAKAQPVAVTIQAGGKAPVPAGSMLHVLALSAGHGAEVTIAAEGEGAEEALDALAALLGTDLDATSGHD